MRTMISYHDKTPLLYSSRNGQTLALGGRRLLQRAYLSSRGRGIRGEGEAPPIVHEALRSPGQPIDPATRDFMEPRFGHDFSNVRVHTDAKAADSAGAVNALAYTVGRNVVFGAGQYRPTTPQGRNLVAHELTHVLQQTAGHDTNSSLTQAEVEADRNATALVDAQSPTVQFGVALGAVQRQESHEGPTPEEEAEALQGDWQEYYAVALQGTTGIPGLSAAEKAELTAKIADEVILLLMAKAPVERVKGRDFPEALWKDLFKSALQTTAGEAYSKKKPTEAVKKAVNKAAEIADKAFVVSEEARWRLAKLFRQHPLPSEAPKKREQP